MKKAFTLIELLVVILIIVILASLLFPVFSKAIEKSKSAQCMNNLKQIGLAMNLYAQDADGYMVPFALVDERQNADGTAVAPDAICGIPVWSWVELLGRHVKTMNVFRHGPKDTQQPCGWGPVQWAGQIGEIGPGQWGYGTGTITRSLAYQLNPVVHLRNGAVGWSDTWGATVDYHSATFRPDFDALVSGGTYRNPNTGALTVYSGTFFERAPYNGDGSFRGWAPTLEEDQIHQPSRLISAIDCRAAYAEPGSRYIWGAGRTGWGQSSMAGPSNAFELAHGNYANVLYCDGHVGSTKMAKTWASFDRDAGAWNNSPFPDGGLWNRMGTPDPADDWYYSNIIPYRHHGISINWWPDNETIFELDGTYGEYNTSGRPAGPCPPERIDDPIRRMTAYNSAPTSYWFGTAHQ